MGSQGRIHYDTWAGTRHSYLYHYRRSKKSHLQLLHEYSRNLHYSLQQGIKKVPYPCTTQLQHNTTQVYLSSQYSTFSRTARRRTRTDKDPMNSIRTFILFFSSLLFSSLLFSHNNTPVPSSNSSLILL